MGNIKLKTKFAGLIIVLIAVSLVANLAWTSENKRAQMENELREKGMVLTQQMDAVWEFMASNQDRLEQISYTDDGVYQGLHCAIAGRSIGQLFTSQSSYTTRFVNFNPRNQADEPDAFEARALDAFYADSSCREFYEITQYQGEEVFRYLAPMRIEKNCLDCHGEPAGEIDVTGYAKEGWRSGDVGGAISIVIPLDVYMDSEKGAVVQDVIFFGGMLVACLVIMYLALTYLVTRPLSKIQAGVERIHRSNLVGMGILPLQFLEGESAESLGLDGTETVTIGAIDFSSGLPDPGVVSVTAVKADGSTVGFEAIVRVDTPTEGRYFAHGGILQYVLRNLAE